ncbi:MAG: ABC transporter permease [Candidatus Thermochlorobacter aerophilum]|jgi:heme exporter protein C|uniref:Heme exporter protein C n=1 Tax=Candidatus Thermochlorobacter aerophilus TaxID=1868324 RepID=A0A395M2U4_9BACT|nr:MAG: ABC transporter permease [Candidatus Thermochlorobacter aerophilum]
MTKKLAFQIGLYVWFIAVIVAALLSPNKVSMLSETTRNMYFHVPMAITAVVAFLTSVWYSIKYLRTKELEHDIAAETASGLGFLFNLLAMLTGAIWAKVTWGQFWHWDPRQTTIFLVFLMYSAYFALRASVTVAERRAALASVYSIFSFPALIFLYFILPRMVPGLHPGSDKGDVNPAVSATTDLEIRLILYSSMIGFIALFFWLHNLRTRAAKLSQRLAAGTLS